MKKNLIFILLSLALTSVCKLFSQNTVFFNESQNEIYTFKYKETFENNQDITNYFIQKISKSIHKPLNLTKYIYIYKQTSRLTKIDLNNYKISIELENKKNTGDVLYKRFNISDALFPSKIDFEIIVYNQDNQIIEKYKFKNKPLNPKSTKIAKFIIIPRENTFKVQDMTSKTKYSITIENKKFYYTNESKKLFNKKLQLINDYYASDFILKEIFQKLQTFDLQDVDMIPVYDFKLFEIETTYEQLKSKNFPKKLDLSQYDPINFEIKIIALNNQINKLQTIINQLLATLDYVYYNKGLEWLVNGYVDKAVTYFNKSLKINPFYAPSHYQLAKINYDNGKLDKAGDIINEVLAKMYPEQNIRILLLQLTNDIYKAYLNQGEQLIKSEKYNEAIKLLEKGKEFCKITPNIIYTEEISELFARAKYGIFKSYLTVAQKAINTDNLEIAETYIKKAKKYQKDNKNDITNDKEANILLNQIINIYLEKGDKSNESLNFNNALKYFEKASILCDLSTNAIIKQKLFQAFKIAKNGVYNNFLTKAEQLLSDNDLEQAENIIIKAKNYQKANNKEIINAYAADTILTKIKYKQYLKLISDGKKQIIHKQFKYALDNFELAYKLETNWFFEKDDSLDILLKNTARPIILNKIKSGNLKVWANELNNVQDIIDSSVVLQQKYLLAEDSVINKTLSELKIKFHNRKCQNAQFEYNKDIREAQKYIGIKNFIQSEKLFDNAISIATINKSCNIDTSTASELKFKYILAANYQKYIKEAKQLLTDSIIYQSVNKYLYAEKYYSDFKIKKYGLEHIPLFNFICLQNNLNLTIYSITFYTENNNFENALSLLKLLKKKKYPKKYSRNLQENLAKKLAIKDHEENPDARPRPNAIIYTNKDKWLKYFKKTYIKKWKNIK